MTRETHLVMRIVGLGRSAREKAQIRVRQPLNSLYVRVPTEAEGEALLRLKDQVLEELNIKDLELLEEDSDMLAYHLKPHGQGARSQTWTAGTKNRGLLQRVGRSWSTATRHGS